MEALDYLEASALRTLEVLRKAYDDLHDRAYKFSTLLIAGGGAAGIYALGEFARAPEKVYGWAPLAGLALTWFGTAAPLLWSSVTARDVVAGAKVGSLQARYQYEVSVANSDEDAALQALRKADLGKAQGRADKYVDACGARADAIDLAYRVAVIASPSVPVVIALACYFLRR